MWLTGKAATWHLEGWTLITVAAALAEERDPPPDEEGVKPEPDAEAIGYLEWVQKGLSRFWTKEGVTFTTVAQYRAALANHEHPHHKAAAAIHEDRARGGECQCLAQLQGVLLCSSKLSSGRQIAQIRAGSNCLPLALDLFR